MKELKVMGFQIALVRQFLVFLTIGSACFGADTLPTTVYSVDRTGFPDITLSFRAVASDSLPLAAENVKVSENGRDAGALDISEEKPRQIFILAVDTSEKMAGVISEVRKTAESLVDQIARLGKVAILPPSPGTLRPADFVSDPVSTKRGLAQAGTPGAFPMNEVVCRGCAAFQEVASGGDIRTMIVFTTSGDENPGGEGSTKTFSQARDLSRKNSVRIIAVSIGKPADETGEESLKALCKELKGGFIPVPDPKLLPDVCGKIAWRFSAEHFYTTRYKAPNASRDGSRRKIVVSVSAKGRNGSGEAEYQAPADSGEPGISTAATETAEVPPTPPADGGSAPTDQGAVAGGADGAGLPPVNLQTPRVNVHQLKDKLNSQTSQEDPEAGE